MIVDKVKRTWKERKMRRRHWFSPEGAAEAVNEPGLTDLLAGLREEAPQAAADPPAPPAS
jgi:hypothetical protein